jgi:hypothetical protein
VLHEYDNYRASTGPLPLHHALRRVLSSVNNSSCRWLNFSLEHLDFEQLIKMKQKTRRCCLFPVRCTFDAGGPQVGDLEKWIVAR